VPLLLKSDTSLKSGAFSALLISSSRQRSLKKMKKFNFSKVALVLGAAAILSSFVSCHKAEKKSQANDKEILVVSFGTSYNSSRDLTIGGIENAIAENFPEYKVARAFTADTIINILKERENLIIDNVDEALVRAANDGVKTLIVQPTHLMNGFEYTDLQKTLSKYESKFDKVVLSTPLLTSDEDFSLVADEIAAKWGMEQRLPQTKFMQKCRLSFLQRAFQTTM